MVKKEIYKEKKTSSGTKRTAVTLRTSPSTYNPKKARSVPPAIKSTEHSKNLSLEGLTESGIPKEDILKFPIPRKISKTPEKHLVEKLLINSGEFPDPKLLPRKNLPKINLMMNNRNEAFARHMGSNIIINDHYYLYSRATGHTIVPYTRV